MEFFSPKICWWNHYHLIHRLICKRMSWLAMMMNKLQRKRSVCHCRVRPHRHSPLRIHRLELPPHRPCRWSAPARIFLHRQPVVSEVRPPVSRNKRLPPSPSPSPNPKAKSKSRCKFHQFHLMMMQTSRVAPRRKSFEENLILFHFYYTFRGGDVEMWRSGEWIPFRCI